MIEFLRLRVPPPPSLTFPHFNYGLVPQQLQLHHFAALVYPGIVGIKNDIKSSIRKHKCLPVLL